MCAFNTLKLKLKSNMFKFEYTLQGYLREYFQISTNCEKFSNLPQMLLIDNDINSCSFKISCAYFSQFSEKNKRANDRSFI